MVALDTSAYIIRYTCTSGIRVLDICTYVQRAVYVDLLMCRQVSRRYGLKSRKSHKISQLSPLLQRFTLRRLYVHRQTLLGHPRSDVEHLDES